MLYGEEKVAPHQTTQHTALQGKHTSPKMKRMSVTVSTGG